MPISSGFGRGLNAYIPRRRKSISPDKVLKRYSPSYKTQPIYLDDSNPRQVYEVFHTSDPYLPPDRITEEKLVIVKPVTIDKIENVPTAPSYVVEKQPRRQQRFVTYESLESPRYSKNRCCKSVYDVDEYQCCDCTNGRCCKPCTWLGTMCACPLWLWLLLGLLLLGLLGTLIAFLVESPIANPAKRVYQYLYGTNNYESRINITVYLYGEGPCENNIDPASSTTALPLCNQTTTRILKTDKQEFYRQNRIVYNSACQIYKGYFMYLLMAILSLFMNSLKFTGLLDGSL